jgi:glycosyltransferase involved in cell wall biosynthesis
MPGNWFGKNGYLIPPHDIGLLSDRVVRLIKNRGLRKQLGDYVKGFIYQRFNYDFDVRTRQFYLMKGLSLKYKRPFIRYLSTFSIKPAHFRGWI